MTCIIATLVTNTRGVTGSAKLLPATAKLAHTLSRQVAVGCRLATSTGLDDKTPARPCAARRPYRAILASNVGVVR